MLVILHATNTQVNAAVVRAAYERQPRAFQMGTMSQLCTELRKEPFANRQAIHQITSIRFPSAIATTETSVFQSRTTRRATYDKLVRFAFQPTPGASPSGEWATDGSSTLGFAGTASSTAAVVGPSSASFRLTGQFTSSMHAERLALIAALQQTSGQTATIHTDHLNTVRDITRARQPGFVDDSWRYRPGHELYDWLMHTLRTATDDADVRHVKAHTGSDDAISRLNDLADTNAKRAQVSSATTWLPPLTGWMRRYVPYVQTIGYDPDNWQQHYVRTLTQAIFESQPEKLKQRLRDATDAECSGKIPEYFYRKSPAPTAKFQLIMRSGQYQTNALQSKIDKARSPSCVHCAARAETERHIFVDCTRYALFRTEAVQSAMRFWRSGRRRPRSSADEASPCHEVTEAEMRSYLEQQVAGPSNTVCYWRGQTAKLPAGLGPFEATIAHHMCITLTSRIAGERARLNSRLPIRTTGSAPDDDDDDDGAQDGAEVCTTQ